MSDNVSEEEQQQHMEEISISGDVWLEIFAFVSPLQLGHEMALISDRFDFLVDEHFKLRKWSLSSLEILRATDGNGAEIVNERSGELLPIPQGPLPRKVIGFHGIEISYIDQSVIEFLQRIRRLFDSGETNVYIATSDDQSRSWEIIRQKIWPFINDNICRFSFFELDHFQQFAPAILRNCAKLRSIHSFGLCPEFPASEASCRQAVAKWLLAPRKDELPKMLHTNFSSTAMEGLRRAFVNASEPANFIIKFWIVEEDDDDFVSFELKNNWTAERLTLQQMDEDYRLLVRCPIAREEAKWAEWEAEAIGRPWFMGRRQRNCIVIDFEDTDIGEGMVEAKAGQMCLLA